MKKRCNLGILLISLLLILGMTSCGNKDSEESTVTTTETNATTNTKGTAADTNGTATETNGTTTETSAIISLTLASSETALPTSGILQEQAKEFEKETGIHIEFETFPDAQWRDVLKTRLTDGTAPDIFVVDSDPFSLYDRIRPDINCIDLTQEEFVSRMDTSVIPAISYEDKVYGITFSGKKIWVYSYRKDIFDSLNLTIPTTYEELKIVCQTLKDNGITPMWEATSSGWHQVLPLFESGPLYASQVPNLYEKLNTNQYNIRNIDSLYTIIQQLNEFAQLGFYGDDYLGNNMDDEQAKFIAGDFAMTLEGIGWPGQLITEHPEMEGKVGIFLMPWADNRIVGINPAANALFGNKNSQYSDEILQFFRFLAQHDQLQNRLDGDPNALEICWPEIKPKYPSEFTTYLNQFESGVVMQAGVSYIDAQWMDVGKDIEQMYAGLMTPEDVLEQIYVRREKLAILSDDSYWK